MYLRFLKNVIAVLGGGPVVASLGLVGYAFDQGFLWAVSLGSVVAVAFASLWRYRRLLHREYQNASSLIDCFSTCVVREAHGLEFDVSITYFLGMSAARDRQEVHYVLETTDSPVTAKHIYVGSQEAPEEHGRAFSYKELRKLSLHVDDVTEYAGPSTEKPRVCAVPYRIDRNKLYLVVGFQPRMAPHTRREVNVSIRRPSLWNSLRSTGMDSRCSYTTGALQPRSIRIRVVIMDSSIPHTELRIEPHSPFAAVGEAHSRRGEGARGPEAIWDISAPQPSTKYEYTVVCKPLASRSVRLRHRIRRLVGS